MGRWWKKTPQALAAGGLALDDDVVTSGSASHRTPVSARIPTVVPEDLLVRDVSVTVPGHSQPLLQGVNFEVPAGSRTALVGVNGVGKSTLLRAIAGITAPVSGQVFVGGREMAHLRPKQRSRLVTLVGQEENPPGDLSVRDVVELGRLPFRAAWAVGTGDDQRIVDEALAAVDLLDLAERPVGQLSGGQRRRALIARGLAQTTGVVMLDEPTNHLDVHHQLHLLELLEATGRTIVATVHDLDLAFTFFDQVVVLHGGGESSHAAHAGAAHASAARTGGVLAAGPPGEVLDKECVRRAFDVGAVVAQPAEASKRHLIIDSL